MVTCLKLKFGEKVSPSYSIKQIDESDLLEKRQLNKLKVFKTIDDSSLFQVVIFNPHHPNIGASSRISLCHTCKEEYRSCDLFESYEIHLEHQRTKMLQNSFSHVQYVP